MTSPSLDIPPPAYDPTINSFDDVGLSLVAQPSTRELLVTLVPPARPKPISEKQPGRRAPVDLCLVIDVSSSMGVEAPVPGEKDKNETAGLSVLDVVKHATRTIIESMKEDDRIAIVTFSEASEVVVPLTYMTKGNQTTVWNKVDRLYVKRNTNLWAGLKAGMDLVTALDPEPASSSAAVQKAVPPPPPATHTSKRSSFLSLIGLSKKKQPIASTSVENKTALSSKPIPHPSDRRLRSVFILTDGQPNVEPSGGHIPALKSYLDALPSDAPKFTISTFGFGHILKSMLLSDIASIGQGTYGFVPDSGMVGTVFIHAVSNLMSTWTTNCFLYVEVVGQDPKEYIDIDVPGFLPTTYSSWGARVQVGDIQYGQSRDVIFKLPVECFDLESPYRVNITACHSPRTLHSSEPISRIRDILTPAHTVDSSVQVQHEAYRLAFVQAIAQIFAQKIEKNAGPPIDGPTFEKSLANHMNNPVLKDHEPSIALTADITSQVVMGLGTEHWRKWGAHYLPSLARSHQLQRCTNFKDEGLQVYGRHSELFVSTRDRIDSLFDSLPPPTPALKDRHFYRYGSSTPATFVPVSSMSKFRSKGAPCFAGWCRVDIGQGRFVKVSDLRRGTEVRTPTGTAQVAAVLRTACPGGIIDLCAIGELAVTPWHPVMHDSVWVFPADICEPRPIICEAVYSILLKPLKSTESHSIFIEGTWCVTLGHGCTDPVRAHEFLGDYGKVVQALSKMGGYYSDEGIIESSGVLRNGSSGRVCGFKDM
ncbi:hypothetical protein RhiJN_08674 [Ceratobasidium sp. AG-Ba]|nr:hypothetical protein RhiJN_08674 [Ceratobasidium sp. AG-Ba]QRW09452.1 hypothetical protein RhiLY_08451 [Ceratobasidium sp. AG-Ba]